MEERYFLVRVRVGDGIYVLALAARNHDHADEIIDRLTAHGHSLSGMVNGVAADDCEEIEGYDAASEEADEAMLYVAQGDLDDDDGDEVKPIPGATTEISAAEFAAIKARV